MIIAVTAIEHDGLDERSITMLFEVPNANFDLIAAAKAAATDYCLTEEGRKEYEGNCKCFNWADFFPNVPNEICEKHGFRMLGSDSYDSITVNWDEHLVDDDRIAEADAGVADYSVNVAVKGRVRLNFKAYNFEEAKKKASSEMDSANLGDLEVIDWEVSSAVNLDADEECDYNVIPVSAAARENKLECYVVTIIVDGRYNTTVTAESFDEAGETATDEAKETDFADLETDECKPVNATNLTTNESYDF